MLPMNRWMPLKQPPKAGALVRGVTSPFSSVELVWRCKQVAVLGERFATRRLVCVMAESTPPFIEL